MAHYVASKGGAGELTKAFAREFASRGITVNTIAPSIDVLGPMVPLGRAGTPDDIAASCAFLCSEDAGYITGKVIGVNGGRYV